MQITLLDERSETSRKIQCDFEAILMQAEQMGGDIVKYFISLLEEQIGYNLTEPAKHTAASSVRRFMALGELEEPLVLRVKGKIKEPRLNETRGLDMLINSETLSFEEVVTFPDRQYQERYERLVGLDGLKKQIQKEATVLLAPELLARWSKQYHGIELSVLRAFKDRYPFMIFEGDVGTGKTEFAETFGAAISASINKRVSLARMSMKSRGNGVVGEMSKLIAKAFVDSKVIAEKTKAPVILLLDEADSLAQSREESQMHHEDRAGVNALIQGIDHVRESNYPILIVFCTNRSQAIDPAIKRRAAIIHIFKRPNMEQRQRIFQLYFSDLKLGVSELRELAELSGETSDREYGFTYSDLITRILPQAVFEAFPDSRITFETIKGVISQLKPTPPFKEG